LNRSSCRPAQQISFTKLEKNLSALSNSLAKFKTDAVRTWKVAWWTRNRECSLGCDGLDGHEQAALKDVAERMKQAA
jgi:hypothetical protein